MAPALADLVGQIAQIDDAARVAAGRTLRAFYELYCLILIKT